jgi:hypothetical protein
MEQGTMYVAKIRREWPIGWESIEMLLAGIKDQSLSGNPLDACKRDMFESVCHSAIAKSTHHAAFALA